MDRHVTEIVIVGGGTAGWLAACVLAASVNPGAQSRVSITLIESPDVPTIGVGEGTWPTIRGTLERIGIAETEFLLACDACFKQGSRFDDWLDGTPGDIYLHPFVPPPMSQSGDSVALWRDDGRKQPFADFVSPQPQVCALGLAPRQRAMAEYSGAINYAYHLDAAKLALLLSRHATERLGVRHVSDHVTHVDRGEEGDVAAVRTRTHGAIAGDLFVDCSGSAALLIEGCCGVASIDRTGELFNDRALVLQVPVPADSAIASTTNATAHSAGWIFDIGLPTRRGLGCVYSSAHLSEADAEATLRGYIGKTAPWVRQDSLSPRLIRFRSAYRERPWERNVVAVGQAGGFIEPLEASAIVMIELALDALVRNFPKTRAAMDIQARRFNDLARYRWERIVEFVKLHYLLSRRPEPYWRDHRQASTVPPRLADLMQVWKDQVPSEFDLPAATEVFSAASHQYILYGMGFPPPDDAVIGPSDRDSAQQAVKQGVQRTRSLTASLPTNRAYLDALREAHSVSLLTKDMTG